MKAFVYVGKDEKDFNILALNIGTSAKLYLLDPEEQSLNEMKSNFLNKTLMQRYSLIEKVKEAEVIGILVGSVVVDNYIEIINNLKVSIT